jgi:hypothetical protein
MDKDIVNVSDETGEATVVGNEADRQMVEYSQAQHNPGATSGMPPQGPAPAGSTLDEVGNMAARRTKRWGKGFNPDIAKQEFARVMAKKQRAAAKGTAGGQPQFWLYDEKAKQLFSVKRDAKTGKLVIGKNKADAFERYPVK